MKGIYIYGVVPNFYGTTHFQSLENSGVYAITHSNISAIVSESSIAGLDQLDRESLGHLLVHHQKTIEELQAKGFTMIIPMRLGTIVKSTDEVINILTRGYDLIIDSLKKIEYLTEIDLVVTWADFTSMLKDIAELPDVKEMKNEIIREDGTTSKVDQCKIGILLKEKIDEKNKATELAILDSLSPFGIDIKIHEVMNGEMITNSAFLLHRNKQEKFEAAIEALDTRYSGLLNFKLVGPLPCYSYFTLEVKSLDAGSINSAGKELELGETTTEAEIKKAFLKKAKIHHPDSGDNNFDPEKFNSIQNAYHTLIDYQAALKQTSRTEQISLNHSEILDHLILVKIKE